MRRYSPAPILISVVFVVVSACSGGGLGPGPTTPRLNIDNVEFASFSLVNGERRSAGMASELSREQKVAELARQFSEQMRDEGFFAHTSPDGQTLRQRLRDAGIDFKSVAENLVKVTSSADPATFAHTLLMQQPQHRDNILGSQYQLLGVGATRRNDTVWITQVFVER